MLIGKAILSPIIIYSLKVARIRVERLMLATLYYSLLALVGRALVREAETKRYRKLAKEAISVKLYPRRLSSSRVVTQDTIAYYLRL